MATVTATLTDASPISGALVVKPDHEVFITLGSMNAAGAAVAETLGGGTVRIGVKTADGSAYQSIKDITAITDKDDKAARAVLAPNTHVVVILNGSSGGSLYVELKQAKRDRP